MTMVAIKGNDAYPGMDGSERGLFITQDFEPDGKTDYAAIAVLGYEGPSEEYERMFNEGVIRTFEDILRFVCGGWGQVTWEIVDDVDWDLGQIEKIASGELSLTDADDSGVTAMASGVISKADEERQIVYGWAYVTHDKDGRINFDKSGEFVDDIEEIDKAAVSFMLKHRATDRHHTNVKSGEVVESMVFTKEKIEKMGLDPKAVPLGWWIGTKVDDSTWAEYKAGRLKSFSVHGKGTRKAVED